MVSIGVSFKRAAVFLDRYGPLVILPAMVLLMVVDSTLRYVFAAPLVWSYDAVGLLLLTFLFLCLPHSWHSNAHIRMEMFYERFGPRAKGAVDFLSSLAALLFGGLIAYRGFEGAEQLRLVGKTAQTMPIPHWPFSLFLAAMATLFCLMVVAGLVTDISRLLRREEG